MPRKNTTGEQNMITLIRRLVLEENEMYKTIRTLSIFAIILTGATLTSAAVISTVSSQASAQQICQSIQHSSQASSINCIPKGSKDMPQGHIIQNLKDTFPNDKVSGSQTGFGTYPGGIIEARIRDYNIG